MYGVFVGIQIVGILLTFAAIGLIIDMDGSNVQKMMVCYMIGVLVQSSGSLFEVLSKEPAEALVAIKLQYLGAVFIPLFFSQFIYLYCNQRQPRYIFQILGVVDLLSLLLVWTCDYHHMFYKVMEFVTEGDHPHYVFTYGWGFWMFVWLGALVPFGLSIRVLIRSLLEEYYQRRKTLYIVFVALAAVPAIALLLRAGQKFKDYDVVPPTLAIVLSMVVIFVWSRRNYDLSRAAAETVLHEIEDGVIFLDDEQRIAGYNPAIEEIFYDLDKRMIGKKVTKIRNFPEEIMVDDENREFDLDDRHFEGHIESVNDEKGHLLGYVILIFDITQRKRLVMESIEMREKAEAASKAKSEFMAAMSHEMRTPMNAIVGFAELIKEESLGRKVYQYACDIKEASGRLLEMFNDIWDISSVEAGKMELEQKDYSLKKFLDEISVRISIAAEEKGLAFEARISDSLPAVLRGDEGRIRQVLYNLFDNAVKFTKEGRITMVVDGDYTGPDQFMIKYMIKDTGIGIAEKDLQTIFYNFEQVDSSESRSVEGTGLGLSVAKNIIELMGGSIGVDSTLGRGSTFTVKLPQLVIDGRGISEAGAETLEQREELKMFSAPDSSILVVDDNLINRKVVRGVIKGYGCQIHEAESGLEAIRLVREQKFDIIFMDHMMPEMDGVETARIIREECGENGKAPVIIALTANVMKDIKEMFLSNGFQDFVAKPIDKLSMHKVLSKWIDDKKKQPVEGETVTENIGVEELADIFITGVNVKEALQKHTGDLNQYVEILGLFYIDGLRKTEYIEQLYENQDYHNYRIEVHALKSASANIGAKDLSEQAALLEMAAAADNEEYIQNNHGAMLEAYKTLLQSIKEMQDKQREKEQRLHPEETEGPLEQEEIRKAIADALDAVEHFHSKDGKERIEWLLNHELEKELREKLLVIQERLRLYEDDEAEDLLRELLQ